MDDEDRGTPLDFLQAVIDCEDLPLPTRMRAAIAAAPYVHPKLEAIAISQWEGNMGDRLTRARERVEKHRQLLLEGKVIGAHNGDEVVIIPNENRAPLAKAPRRF